MILVITPESPVQNEADHINEMFQEGLDLLHIRKPGITRERMIDFINEINQAFYPRLVLHNHFDLGKEFAISRLHFREHDRKENVYQSLTHGYIISTSVHEIATYNTLEKDWEYSFVSPFFPSISKKGYGEHSTVMEDIKQRNNLEVRLIALGGIHPGNIQNVFDAGADGAALLGAIWESDEPVNIFKKCKKNVRL